MPKLRDISGKKLVKIFENLGFTVVGQKGSHVKMAKFVVGINQTLVIPNHPSISKGTLKNIYTQASEYISEKNLKKHFYS